MRRPALRVKKRFGKEALGALAKMELLDKGFKVRQLDDSIAIPLVRRPTEAELKLLSHLKPVVCVENFEPRAKAAGSLKDLLKDRIPNPLLGFIPSSLDLVGEVAIMQLPEELEEYSNLVGEAVMRMYPRVKTVLAKVSPISGDFRVRLYKVIAGSGETETIHREYGCLYLVDPLKVYFSPRLGYERFRVASMVKSGEVVLDMFTGVGCYAIMIAKIVKNCTVYAVDLNPAAVGYLKRNIALNRVQGKIIPIQGDVAEIVENRFKGLFDRVIMDHPSKAKLFLKTACKALKPSGGVIHYYGFYLEPDPENKALEEFRKGVEASGRRVNSAEARTVREVSPRKYHIVVDAAIQ